ncbi:hypothetical protein Tco_1011287 [Tanacetum coccineum]
MPGIEVPDRRSCKIRTTSSPGERDKKGKAKIFDTQLGKWKKGEKDTTPVEAPILMISRESHTPKRKSVEEFIKEVGEITFPPVSSVNNSSDRVIIGLNIRKAGEPGIHG